MINGMLNFLSDAFDFRLQCGDARVQLIDGKRIEILPREQPDRIVSLAGQIVFHMHDADC